MDEPKKFILPIHFAFLKDTANKWRFVEERGEMDPEHAGSFYLSKTSGRLLGLTGAPQRIRVTVEVLEA